MPPRQLFLLLALCLGASSALRRFPEEEDLPASRPLDVSLSTEEDQEDLPDFGEGPDEPESEDKVGKERVQLRDTPFKNVLLVAHCRLLDRVVSRWFGGKPTSSAAICNKRKPLFRNLMQFFPEIIWWNGQEDCAPGGASPHVCIAEKLLDRASLRDGIFYMHFDALVRPEVLKHSFNPHAIGTFNDHQHCDMDTGCGWGAWVYWRDALLQTVDASAAMGFPVETEKFWLGVDDLFYMPRAIFPTYKELVRVWNMQHVHHEVAGPTMWRILGRHRNVPVVSLGCTGGCCQEVHGSEALTPSFRCGHPFRLNNADTREAFTKAQLMS